MSSRTHRVHRAPVLEVQAAVGPDCGEHPPPHRTAQQASGLIEIDEATFEDLPGLQALAFELLGAEFATVKEEPQPTRPARRLRRPEVHTDQAAACDLDPTLLAGLAPARLPRRLAILLELPARNRPATLVARLQNQQPAQRVKQQRAADAGTRGTS